VHVPWGVFTGRKHPKIKAAAAHALELGIMCSYETERHSGLANRITELVPSADMVRFAGSGTETVIHALCLPRTATGRDRSSSSKAISMVTQTTPTIVRLHRSIRPVHQLGMYFGLKSKVRNYREAARQNRAMLLKFIRACIDRGVYFHVSPHHGFSAAHMEVDVDRVLEAIEGAVSELKQALPN